MIPPSTRRRLNSTFSTTSSYAWSGLRLSGSALWILSTTVLLIGVPLGLSVMEEQGMIEAEMEQKAREIGQNVSPHCALIGRATFEHNEAIEYHAN